MNLKDLIEVIISSDDNLKEMHLKSKLKEREQLILRQELMLKLQECYLKRKGDK